MWPIAVVAVLIVTTAGLVWMVVASRHRRSADDLLAEIEAARAIPDAENAAVIYNHLLQDPNATSIMDDFPESPPGDVFNRVRREPWLEADFPEPAIWFRERQFVIDRLLEASRFEQCRFPINIDTFDILTSASELDRGKAIREWGFLLAIVANNDLAEGRGEDAMQKWRCLLRMGSHLGQHPTIVDHLVDQAITSMALDLMARFMMTGDATEPHLREIEALCTPIEGNLVEQLDAARSVEDLRALKMKESFGPGGRLAYHFATVFTNRSLNSALDDLANQRRCAVRGIRILIALRRYRMTMGHWPHSLDEVKPSLSGETLTDPISKGPFVYRPAGNTFMLYSKGKNKIDEHGKRDRDTGADDWPVWPPRGRRAEAEHENQ